MNELRLFTYEGSDIRTVMIGSEPWWVLKDVCAVLGLSNPTIVAARLDSDEVTKSDLGGLSGESNIINESGLYNVILRSDKPEAKRFKRWVTHDVLPDIRRHGVYATPARMEQMMDDPDAWISVLNTIKEERSARHRLQLEAAENRPKVIFADAVSVSPDSILIGELAKILKGNGVDIGQKRLFEKMRRDGYLIRRQGSDYNMPTQRSMELGLFKIKETAITHSDGRVTISKTARVTGKGQQYFVNLFLEAQTAERH